MPVGNKFLLYLVKQNELEKENKNLLDRIQFMKAKLQRLSSEDSISDFDKVTHK